MTGKSCSSGLSSRSFVNCSYTVKYVLVVTSIKRSCLKQPYFLDLSNNKTKSSAYESIRIGHPFLKHLTLVLPFGDP